MREIAEGYITNRFTWFLNYFKYICFHKDLEHG